MKQNIPARVIMICLFLTLMVSSCEKADLIETPSCSSTFIGEVTSCGANRSAVYRFISANDENKIEIQGDLTNVIGADAVVTVTGAMLTVTQSITSENTSRTIKLEGPVTACQEIIIRISWTSTNSDNLISGDWSVKNADGADLAPAVMGLECDAR